jgi:hypothetical protein
MTSDAFNIYKPSFMQEGKCKKHPTRWWFPQHADSREEQENLKKAKQICSTCNVKTLCLQYGQKTKSMGVWGGISLYHGKTRKRAF